MPELSLREGLLPVQSVKKRVAKIEVCVSTLNLEFIGTSADVDFPWKRDFQSGFECLPH